MSVRGAAKRYPGFGSGALKVYPEHIAGMIGLASVGDIYYVDPGAGSDTANSGRSADDAFKTVRAAHAAMTADQDDVLIIAGTSSTGRTAETDNVVWSKRRTHIVGNGPARRAWNRNGIATDSTLTGETTTAIFTVTGANCSFNNITFATFHDNNILVEVQSDYNTFNNVHFAGIGDDTAGDDANARSLVLNGSGENFFNNCTFGVDTVTRSAANASVELTGVCERNIFTNCDFPIFADAGTPLFVKFANNDAGQRYTKFENCWFHSPILASSTAIADGMVVPAALNGTVILDNCWSYGVTDIADDYTKVFVNNPAVGAADQTFMIIGAAG